MRETYYLCGDKRAYKFALKNYANTFTQVAFCKIHDDTDAASWLIFENINKEFYIFECCRNGYLKVKLKTYLSLEPNEFEGFYIPYKAKKSPKTGKPKEQYIKGIIDGDSIIQTN